MKNDWLRARPHRNSRRSATRSGLGKRLSARLLANLPSANTKWLGTNGFGTVVEETGAWEIKISIHVAFT